MHPGSTLFLDVCTQRDYWPGGAWPLIAVDAARNITTLFELAASLGVRQGGACCLHGTNDAATAPAPLPHVHAETVTGPQPPRHCVAGTDGTTRAPGCAPARPAVIVIPGGGVPTLDRAHAYYVASGCAAPVDEAAGGAVLDHLVAGVRDVVVFGAGLEGAMRHAVAAVLRRRVRTHVVLDAAAAADDAEAQRIVASWKRRGVDGATTATIARLLTGTGAP